MSGSVFLISLQNPSISLLRTELGKVAFERGGIRSDEGKANQSSLLSVEEKERAGEKTA